VIRTQRTTALRLCGFALVSVGLASCGSGGGSDGDGDTVFVPVNEVRLTCKVTEAPIGSNVAVPGAVLTYQTALAGVAKTTTTDANGDCAPLILQLNEITDTDFPAATVNKAGFEPQTVIFSKLEGGRNYFQDVSLVKLLPNVSIPVDGGTVWHLGDGRFSAEINSKFQKALDGPAKDFAIADWATQAAGFAKATLYLDHKGWQTATCPANSVALVGNAGTVTKLGKDSPPTGDWGGGPSAPVAEFNVAEIGTASATIRITAGRCNGGAPGDLDDFEINRMRVVFSN